MKYVNRHRKDIIKKNLATSLENKKKIFILEGDKQEQNKSKMNYKYNMLV